MSSQHDGSVILWPLTWMPLLDSLESSTDSTYQAHIEDIAEMAFHLTLFSAEEINQFAGDTVQILISPALIPATYSIFREYRSLLGSRIWNAYREQKGAQ